MPAIDGMTTSGGVVWRGHRAEPRCGADSEGVGGAKVSRELGGMCDRHTLMYFWGSTDSVLIKGPQQLNFTSWTQKGFKELQEGWKWTFLDTSFLRCP